MTIQRVNSRIITSLHTESKQRFGDLTYNTREDHTGPIWKEKYPNADHEGAGESRDQQKTTPDSYKSRS